MSNDQVNALFAQLGLALSPLSIDASEAHQSWGIALADDLNVLVQLNGHKGCLVLSQAAIATADKSAPSTKVE